MDINDLEKIKSVLIKIDNLNKLNLDENSRLFIKEISQDNNFLNDFIEKNGEDGLFIIINGILENLHNSYQNIIESKKYFREEDLKISKEIINEMFLNKNKQLDYKTNNDFINIEQEENDRDKINEILNKLKQ